MSTTAADAVRKSIEVAVPPERAWKVFTEQRGSWWPLATHSIGVQDGVAPDGLVVEGRVGGTIYETLGDERRTWGTILEWVPPTRLSVEWTVNASATTRWTATFSRTVSGTRLELVHVGFEAHGEQADAVRGSYGSDDGWTSVLARFAAAVGPAG